MIGSQQHFAHPDRVAVTQDAIDLDCGINEVVGILEVIAIAALHCGHIVLHDRQRRAKPRFEEAERARVIDVGVTGDHQLDRFGFKAEFADGIDDHRSRRGHARVHQNVALRCRDQKGPESFGAHEVDRPGNPDGLSRLLPFRSFFASSIKSLLLVARSSGVTPFGNC